MTGYLLYLMKCSHLKDILALSSLQDHITFANLHQSRMSSTSTSHIKLLTKTRRFVIIKKIPNASTFKFIIGPKVFVKTLYHKDVILDGYSKLLICNGSLRDVV